MGGAPKHTALTAGFEPAWDERSTPAERAHESGIMVRSIPKWIILSILSLLVMAALLSLLLRFAVSLPSGQRYLLGILQSRGGKFLEQQVRIGKIETDLFFRLKVRDVGIFQERRGQTIPFLNIGQATIRYNIFGLLLRKFTMESINIRDLKVTVIADSTGNTNIPLVGKKHAPPPKNRPGPIEFRVRKISMTNSILRYLDRSIPIDAELAGASGELSAAFTEGWSFRVSADSIRFAYKAEKLAVTRIRAKGNWSGNGLRLERAAANFPGILMTGENLVYRTGPDSLLSGDFRLTGDPGAIFAFTRATVARGLPRMNGAVDMRVGLGGSPGNPRFTVVFAAPVFHVAGVRMENGYVRGSWANPVVEVDSLSLNALGGNVYGRGTLNTRTFLAENVSLFFRNLDVRRMGRLAGVSSYRGILGGWIGGGGYVNDPGKLRAAVNFSVRGPEYLNRRIPDMRGKATLSGGTAEAAVSAGELKITAGGRIDRDRMNGGFSLDIRRLSDFAELLGSSEVTGRIAARGTINGALSSPAIQATVSGDSIAYARFPLNSLHGEVEWRNGAISFSDLRMSGRIASFAELGYPLHVNGLSGGMRYSGVIDGPLNAPRGEITVDMANPSYQGVFFDKGRLSATVHGDTVSVVNASLENGSVRVLASGALDYHRLAGSAAIDFLEKTDGPGSSPAGRVSALFNLGERDAVSASISGEDVSLPFFRNFLTVLSEAAGTLNFHGTVGGGMKNPEAGLAFSILKPGFRTTYLDSLRGELSLRDGLVLVKPLEMFREDSRSILEGSLEMEKTDSLYRITRNTPVQGTIRGEKLRLAYIEDIVPGIDHLDGNASYDISFGGDLSDPHPSGTMTITGLSVSMAGKTPSITGVDILTALRDDTVTINIRNGMILREPFSIDALVNYTPAGFGGNIDFSLAGAKALNVSGDVSGDHLRVTTRVEALDLSMMSAFLPFVGNVSGVMNSDITITGTLKNPQPNGTLSISGLNLDIPEVDMPIRDGIVRLGISPNRVVIDTMLVKSRKGSIRISGTVSDIFSESTAGDLRAVIDNLQIKKKNSFDVMVNSARLTFAGAGNDFLLEGKTNLGESKVISDFTVKSLLQRLAVPEGPQKPPPEFMKNIRLDVLVGSGEKLSIDNSLVNVRMRADIELIGTLAEPYILGAVTLNDGEVRYLDRTFKITEGSLDFTDRTKLNPALNIQAQATVTSFQAFESEPYVITLSVTGTMEEPAFALTSDPELDKPNIISLLTLGVTRQQVGIGTAAGDTTSSFQDVLKKRAELLTSQQIGGYLGSHLEDMLGLEGVMIEGNLFDINGEQGGPRIIASKRISDTVEVTSITTLGRLGDQGIRVNYSVTEKVTLQGETDSQGRSGFDVMYRLRFR